MTPILHTLFSLLLLASLCFGISGCSKKAENTDSAASTSTEKPVSKKPDLTGPMKFTYIAKCQMRCGRYKTSVIRDAFKNGKIVTRERWLNKKPCPFYAVNHTLANGDPIVIVLAKCETPKSVIKIIRVFNKNLKECDCKSKKAPANS